MDKGYIFHFVNMLLQIDILLLLFNKITIRITKFFEKLEINNFLIVILNWLNTVVCVTESHSTDKNEYMKFYFRR